jgi:hypothetical protein
MAFQKTGKAEQVGEAQTFEQMQKRGRTSEAGDDANRERENVEQPKQSEKRPRDFRN